MAKKREVYQTEMFPVGQNGRICRKCKEHGELNFLRNKHKNECLFKDCQCDRCALITKSRLSSKNHLKETRNKEKVDRLIKVQSKLAFKGVLPTPFRRFLHRGTPVAGNWSLPTTNKPICSPVIGIQRIVDQIKDVLMETQPVPRPVMTEYRDGFGSCPWVQPHPLLWGKEHSLYIPVPPETAGQPDQMEFRHQKLSYAGSFPLPTAQPLYNEAPFNFPSQAFVPYPMPASEDL